MDSNLNNENDEWELGLDIDDSNLRLTPVLVNVAANILKHPSKHNTRDEDRMLTQEYIKELVEDVGEDEDYKSVPCGCLGDIDKYLNNGKLDLVVAIVKSCSLNVIGDLTVNMKDPLGKIPGTIHYKVLDEGNYGKDITIGASMILTNVSGFTHKPLVHYLNITRRNVVKVFL
nr:hypothetical protein [Tanacetum cinerariifolium]